MGRATIRSFVFAVEFTIGESERVAPVLARHEESLRDLGAHYAFVYESIVEPGKVMVVIGVRTAEPLLKLLRSPSLFEWFDAVGLDDLPAVFAGETVERFDIGEPPAPGCEIVVAAVTPVADVADLIDRVRGSLHEFARAGIRRTLVYRAFDTPHEVMFLQQLASETNALTWVERPAIAASWLAATGGGRVPARIRRPLRQCHASGRDQRDGPALMYVCLCLGITNETVWEAVAAGAETTRQVSDACGAGSECGRCRRTIRSIIDSVTTTTESDRGSRV